MFRKPESTSSTYNTSYSEMNRWVVEKGSIQKRPPLILPATEKPLPTALVAPPTVTLISSTRPSVSKPTPLQPSDVTPRPSQKPQPSIIALSMLTRPPIKLSGVYNQNALIEKINLDLKQQGRKLLAPGYCNGLSLLWLSKISEGREQWFYDRLQRIIDCPVKNLDDIEIDIEKFLAQMEWAQHSTKYMPSVHQRDAAIILEAEKIKYLKSFSSQAQLELELKQLTSPGKMINISAGPSHCLNLHTIGLFQRENTYYIYDSNYSTGVATEHRDLHSVLQEIMQCLFMRIGRGLPGRFDFEIEVVSPKVEASLEGNKVQMRR